MPLKIFDENSIMKKKSLLHEKTQVFAAILSNLEVVAIF